MVGILVFANWGRPQVEAGIWSSVYHARWIVTGVLGAGLGLVLVAWFGLGWVRLGVVALLTILLAAGTNYVNDYGKGWRGEHPHRRLVARLEAASGKPFAELLHERVLDPMGMTLSTYEQPLPETRWSEAASAYHSDGRPVEDQWHVYPEQAAAGLWTTPTELARWGLGILAAHDGAEGGVLSPDMAQQMVERSEHGHGLGPQVARNGLWFGHGGSNEGFRCQLVVFFDGRGAAVMTNADNGGIVMQDILATLADEYDWPMFGASERTIADLPDRVYAEIAGRYGVPDADSIVVVEIVRENGQLRLDAPGLPRFELLPGSEQLWFTRETGTRATVEWEDGRVIAFRMFGFRAEKLPE